jgi:superoxide dismutase, Cu-Zn family
MKLLLSLAAVLAFAGAAVAAPPTKAIAVLTPTKDSTVKGTLTFSTSGGGVAVSGEISGLKPGTHGFHVHEFGDCSAPDGASAGGHWNPLNQPHAAPAEEHRHVGDLGNIEAGADGVAKIAVTDSKLSLSGESSILGRGVIVHTNADDLKTQPTGNAGGRLACGVIGAAKSE